MAAPRNRLLPDVLDALWMVDICKLSIWSWTAHPDKGSVFYGRERRTHRGRRLFSLRGYLIFTEPLPGAAPKMEGENGQISENEKSPLTKRGIETIISPETVDKDVHGKPAEEGLSRERLFML